MQKYSDVVLDKNGKAIAGATITVSTYPDSLAATIYAADGGTAVPSVITDSNGRFAFYAVNGHYSVNVTGQGITPITYNDILLFDPEDDVVDLAQFVRPNEVSHEAAMQRAINALPATGGTVRVRAGNSYRMNAGVSITKSLRIIGEGKLSTTIRCIGANGGQPFFSQTAGDGLSFESITISGDGVDAGPIAASTSVCYQSANNTYTHDARFMFWDTVSTWAGGYYHRHSNSFFESCRLVFKNYDQNNITFTGCRFANLEQIMTVASGEGPITLLGCSVENIAAKAFFSASRQVALNMFGGYLENNPTTSCPSGISSTSGKFDQGVLVYSQGSEIYPVVLEGVRIFSAGWLRIVYNDSTAGSHLVARGNSIIARGLGPTDTIYLMSGTNVSCELHDEIIGALPTGATYVSGLPASMKGCTVFDPVARDYIKPVQSWTAATVQNAWTNGSNAGWTVDRTGRVQLRGTVSGGSATAATMFTLPAGLAPAVGKFFVCSYNGGFVGVRVLATGAVYLDAAVGATMNGINLDPISFYPGS